MPRKQPDKQSEKQPGKQSEKRPGEQSYRGSTSSAGRALRRGLVPAVTVAAFALGYGGTVAVGHATTAGARQDAVAVDAPGTRPTPGPTVPATATAEPAEVGSGVVDATVKPYLAPKLLAAVPVGPGKVSERVRTVLTSRKVITALDTSGIPVVAAQAYRRAAASEASCHLPWQVLAAIGRVESDNGRFGGARLRADGDGTRPILGIPLDGRHGVALVRDTDNGRLDGDRNFDRAVGPMQFVPSTWAMYKADGNGDGKADPGNIFDAARAAADYLCDGGADLSKPAEEAAALSRYNNADEYVRVVLGLAAKYQHREAATTAGPAATGARSHRDPADVGWAPAMRQVVVTMLTDQGHATSGTK